MFSKAATVGIVQFSVLIPDDLVPTQDERRYIWSIYGNARGGSGVIPDRLFVNSDCKICRR